MKENVVLRQALLWSRYRDLGSEFSPFFVVSHFSSMSGCVIASAFLSRGAGRRNSPSVAPLGKLEPTIHSSAAQNYTEMTEEMISQ